MNDSTSPHLEDPIDRFARGELTGAAGRELAQASLSDPELFEELTFSALTKAALEAQSLYIREQLEPPESATVFPFPRKAQFFVGGAVAAALIAGVSFYYWRPSSGPDSQTPLAHGSSRGTAPVFGLLPALPGSAKQGQPILLASGFQPVTRRGDGPIFRGAELDARAPQPEGSIVSLDDGLASIDLGSLDGLDKGTELQVFADERAVQPIGRLTVTTVFRLRARARILAGEQIQATDRVRTPAPVYLSALWQQVDALFARGDAEAARAAGARALEWSQTADLPPSDKRKALERMAKLEYQAGELPAAEKHYQSAVDSLQTEPLAPVEEQLEALNNLGVLHLLRGDYDGAQGPLSQAVSKSPRSVIQYPRGLNNMGVMAELRGDRKKAGTYYGDSLRALENVANSPTQERQLVEANLARIKGAR